ncbi:MAG: hypothetical protein RL748_2012 [Pseudomonadota bacterium]|jgi:hypothetical protein
MEKILDCPPIGLVNPELPEPVMRGLPQLGEEVSKLFSGIEGSEEFSADAVYAAFSGIRRKPA